MIDIHPAAAIVVHGGAGGEARDSDGCIDAAVKARRALERSGEALAAAMAAVVSMEDDSRFNAGTGFTLGLDGEIIEMDAAVMDTLGRLGSVAGIRRVKNPVPVARDVAASPHRMLCGEGATRFARVGGYADFYSPTDKSRDAHRTLFDSLGPEPGSYGMLWNYDRPPPARRQHTCDTVGAVVRGPNGQFAVAASTGGSAPALLGRVGDTPLIGCGFSAGKLGAVSATGVGEHINPHLLAHTVYQWLADGIALEQALARALGLFEDELDIGIIGVTPALAGGAAKRPMPLAVL